MNDQDPGPIVTGFLKCLWVFVGLIVGGAIGVACGLGLTIGLVSLAQVAHPNDSSTASSAIAGILLVPGGLLWGAATGAIVALKLQASQ